MLRRFSSLLALLGAAACAPPLPTGRIIDQPGLQTRMDVAQGTPQRQRRGLAGTPPLATEAPIVVSAPLQREVDRIMERLLRDPPIGVQRSPRVLVRADDSYGAEMTRDGEIHVNIGLLSKAASEDEIAFVLAHEAAHYLLGHGINRDGTLRAGRGSITLARNASVYGIAIGASQGQGAVPAAGTRRNAAVGMIAVLSAGEALTAIAAEIGDASYSRQQEIEADRLGLDLLVRAGYQTGATGSVFNQLEARHREQEGRAVDLRGSVGGGVIASANLLTSAVPVRNELARLGLTVGTMLVAAVAEQAAGGMLSGMSATHDKPEVRRADLQEYEVAHYADGPDRDPSPNSFARAPLGREVVETMQALEVLRRVQAAIDADDAAGARDALRGRDALMERRTPVQWRFARSRIAAMEGNEAERGRLLAEAVRHPQAYAHVYVEQARFLERRGNVDGALQALRQGEQSFGTPEPFIAERVRILRDARRDQELAQALAQCRTLHVGPIERECSSNARRADVQPAVPTGPAADTQRPL
ncbi:M48 family metalloprotease [Roseicella aerolata]|uniref:M48 family metalloprotease n=1 Tax=Roseicella aerolata TaxID=2883479 RepID=A0A9X1IJ03_9PROT|nr:M48 family metalloprotease [Roseicella aerolata]MCB4825422.1 M48 family metalloprotease [Roseicella aerolata]